MKFRKRVGGASSGQRWAKGHSSDSNPTRRVHRDAALGKLSGSAALGFENDQHRLATADCTAMDNLQIDADQSDGRTEVESAFTRVTNCTNATFARVHQPWSGTSRWLQSDTVAVLGAVNELIAERDGDPSNDVDCFAALLATVAGLAQATTFPKEDGHVDGSSDARLAAGLLLLATCARRVPATVLKAQWQAVGPLVCNLLAQYAAVQSKYDASAMRVGSSVASSCLHIAQTAGNHLPTVSWMMQDATSLGGRLVLCARAMASGHPEAHVRKRARSFLHSLINSPPVAAGDSQEASTAAVKARRALASSVVTYCTERIESSGGAGAGRAPCLRSLNLLKVALHRADADAFRSGAETLLRLFTLADNKVRLAALQTLRAVLLRRPEPGVSLSESTCDRLLGHMLDLAPAAAADRNSAAAAAETLTEALLCMLDQWPLAACSHVPRVCEAILDVNAADMSAIMHTYERLIESGLRPLLSSLSSGKIDDSSSALIHAALHSSLTALRRRMSVTNMGDWSTLLWLITRHLANLAGGLFELEDRLDKLAEGEPLAAILLTLCELREQQQQPDSGAALRRRLDGALVAVVKSAGAHRLLQAVGPDLGSALRVESPTVPRAFLLPLIAAAPSGGGCLQYFERQLAPLAGRIYAAVAKWRAGGKNPLLCKLYDTLERQLWGCLPTFCRRPVGLAATFSGGGHLARIIGIALMQRVELRLCLLHALRNLLSFVTTDAAEQVDRDAIVINAKNFMPVLFNIYTSGSEATSDSDMDTSAVDLKGGRAAALATISLYAHHCPNALLQSYASGAAQRAMDRPPPACLAAADILIALLPAAIAEDCDPIWHFARQLADVWMEDGALSEDVATRSKHKKACRVVELAVKCGRGEFFAAQIDRMQSYTVPVSAASRMRVLAAQCGPLKDLDSTLASIVINLPSGGKASTRRAAARALLAVAERCFESHSEMGHPAMLQNLTERILAGVKAAPAVSITKSKKSNGKLSTEGALLGCEILVRRYGDELNATACSGLLLAATQAMADSRCTQSVVCGARLFRSTVISARDYTLKPMVDDLLRMLFTTCPSPLPTSPLKQRRSRTRLIFHLCVKFGVEVVSRAAPEKWQPIVEAAAKKLRRRNKRKLEGERKDKDGGAKKSVAASSVASTGFTLADSVADLLCSDGEADASDSDDGGRSRAGMSTLQIMDDIEQEGEVLDLLDERTLAKRLQAGRRAVERKKGTSRENKADGGFKSDSKGRLVIGSLPDEDNADEDNHDSDSEDEDILLSDAKLAKRQQKSAAQANSVDGAPSTKRLKTAIAPSDAGATSVARSYKPGGRGLHRANAAPGSEYKSSRAGGDVQRRGRPQPHAHVPLAGGSGKRKRKFAASLDTLKFGRKAVAKGRGGKGKSKGRKKVPF